VINKSTINIGRISKKKSDTPDFLSNSYSEARIYLLWAIFVFKLSRMFVRQLYTGCLSEAAYYIESNGEAAIIDPLRDIDDYLEIASERKTNIKYLFIFPFYKIWKLV